MRLRHLAGLPRERALVFERTRREIERMHASDPLQFVEQFQQRYRVPELAGMPAFFGGFVGYFGYDTVRYVEPKLKAGMPPDELGTPDILLINQLAQRDRNLRPRASCRSVRQPLTTS